VNYKGGIDMSSFVISKRDYIKAAGYIAGIVKERDRGIHEFFVYDYELGRKMNIQDYYNKFVKCYEMNAKSVQEQYGDDEVETDENTYEDVFNEYMKYGSTDYITYECFRINIVNLHKFFRSVLYQTENRTYATKMEDFFAKIESNLFEILFAGELEESECWGDFEIKKPEREVFTIIG
jgi:hypothetical protein